jgi:ATP-dependent Clp protease ATP-binding subunit ClpC
MVERRFPTGDQFLFVRSDGEAIQVEFVDPNAEPSALPPPRAGEAAATSAPGAGGSEMLAATVLHAAGTRSERDQLLATLARIESELTGKDWDALRDTLSAQMADPDFWNRDDRQRILARYALMDRVKAACGTARSLSERHGRGLPGRAGSFSRELAGRFALQLLLVDRGIRDALNDAPVEVVLSVEPAMDSGGDLEHTVRWCQRVGTMYEGWVTRRHMQGTQRALPSLVNAFVVTGFGAASVLSRENGLHVLEGEESRRCVARVRVAELWTAESASDIPAAVLVKALAGAPAASAIVRRYRLEPSPLVRDAERGWRTGRLDDVMAGDFDLF